MTVQWQAIPTEELTRLADEVAEVLEIVKPALDTGLVWKLEGVERMLRWHREHALDYNVEAGLH